MHEKNTTKLTSQFQATTESWERFKHNRTRDWSLFGHDMGVHQLNLALGGWIPGKITTIGGRSGSGKTAWVGPMLKASARVLAGRRAEFMFFSWEMGASYLVDRIVCSEVGVTLRMLNQGAKLLSENHLNTINKVYKEISKIPVTYQQFSTNIDQIKAIGYEFVEECERKSEIEGIYVQPVIVIDYVGMAQFEGDGLRTYGIASFMNGLKQFVNTTGASALVLAQINRSADGKIVPDRSDFSDSQSIEMASDNLIIIHRPEYSGQKTVFDPQAQIEVPSDNKTLVRILKSRDYGTGDFLVESDLKYFRIYDPAHTWDYKYYELYNNKGFWLNHFGLTDNSTEQLKIA